MTQQRFKPIDGRSRNRRGPFSAGILAVIALISAAGVLAHAAAGGAPPPASMLAFGGDELLHVRVIPHSDEAVDQALKLQVRQTVLPFLLEIGAAAVGSPDALAAFEKAAEPIRRLAENAVRAAGFDYPVSVEIGPHRFPDRSGGDWSLPAGEYNSVVITIGEGAGANWWCVLFPPMCIDGAVEDRGTPESAGIPWETAPSVEAQAPAGREATSGGADRDVKEHGDRISVEWSVGWLQALGENGYGRLLLSWWQATVQAAEAKDL